jgi:hypothetical protein
MTNSTQFASNAEKWASELWKVSLFPVSRPSNDAKPQLRLLENVDEGRSAASFRGPLLVESEAVSGILP